MLKMRPIDEEKLKEQEREFEKTALLLDYKEGSEEFDAFMKKAKRVAKLLVSNSGAVGRIYYKKNKEGKIVFSVIS